MVAVSQKEQNGGFWTTLIRRRNSPAVADGHHLPTFIVSSSSSSLPLSSSSWTSKDDCRNNDDDDDDDDDVANAAAANDADAPDEDDDDLLSTNSSNSSGETTSEEEQAPLINEEPLEIVLGGGGVGGSHGGRTSSRTTRAVGHHSFSFTAATTSSSSKRRPALPVVAVPLAKAWRQPVDVELYMARREMTKTQERWNALTMLPYPAYCLYFVLSAQWFVPAEQHDEALSSMLVNADVDASLQLPYHYECLSPSTSWWHSMPTSPPFPVLAVAVGVSLHAPFSFLYHWQYAHALPPAERSRHWSRRLDHAFIHICSILACCGTTTSTEYIVANGIYNIDCALQHLVKAKVQPRRNQVRCFLALFLYTAPLLLRDLLLFGQHWLVFLMSIWFFVAYPIGGWSHSVFHLFMALSPPLTLHAAAHISDTSLAQWCWSMQQQQQQQQDRSL
jgi:hypothetical protein